MSARRRKLGPGKGSERWPMEDRKRALELSEEKGPSAASRETGIPLGTIAAWRAKSGGVPPRAPEARRSWAERKEEGAVETWEEARSALRLVRERLEGGDERKAKDAALTMAILIDKSAVLEEASALAAERKAALQEEQGQAIAEALAAILDDLRIPRTDAIREVVARRLRPLSEPDAPAGQSPDAAQARADIEAALDRDRGSELPALRAAAEVVDAEIVDPWEEREA